MSQDITKVIHKSTTNGWDDRYHGGILVFWFKHNSMEVPFIPIYELNSTILKSKIEPLE